MQEEITEGKARVLLGEGVFYNEKMRKLRDISVLAVKAVAGKDCKLLDATAATGVRGIRYALECGIKDVTLLDINKTAFESLEKNVKANGVRAKAYNQSVQRFANDCEEAYDVIDLDPFGTPAPYVNDLLKVAKDSTLFMITATDTAVLCGAHANACIKQYAAKPLHNELCHESGVRILLAYVSRIAAGFNFGIRPLLSIADMHYMRIFITLERGAEKAVESVKQNGFVASCSKCRSFKHEKGFSYLPDTCDYCGGKMQRYGPMWLGNLHDKNVIKRMLDLASAYPDAAEMLGQLHEELDMPFFYSIPMLTKSLHANAISPKFFLEELKRRKFVATYTIFERSAIKTSATVKDMHDIARSAAK